MLGRHKRGREGSSSEDGEAPTVESALAFVVFAAPVTLDEERIRAADAALFPGAAPLGPTAEPGEEAADGDTLVFGKDGELLTAVLSLPAGIPDDELDGPATTSWLWKGGVDRARTVGGHVVVATIGPGSEDAVVGRRQVARVAAAISRAHDALGVYVGAAGLLVDAGVWVDLTELVEPDADIHPWCWIDLRAGADGSTAQLATFGMAAFGLPEMEMESMRTSIGDLRELAANTATYLIANGPVIGDGDTVGSSEGGAIVVRHTASMIQGRDGVVYTFLGA